MKVMYRICGWGHPRNQYIWKEGQTFEYRFLRRGRITGEAWTRRVLT